MPLLEQIGKFEKLTKEQLTQDETWDSIQKIYKKFQEEGFVHYFAEIRRLATILGEKLDQYPELRHESHRIYVKYRNLMLELKFRTFHLCDDEEAVELIQKHFLDFFRLGFEREDIEFAVSGKLATLIPWQRDDYLKGLREAFKSSQQRIGHRPIYLTPGSPKASPPTIVNWIKDYGDFAGVGLQPETKVTDYLFRSRNVQLIKKEVGGEKLFEVLKNVINFYNILHLDISYPGSLGGYSLETLGLSKEEYPAEPPSVSVGLRPIPLRGVPSVVKPLEARPPEKPKVIPPPKPSAEIEKEIEAKRKAEEERIARLEREIKPKIAPSPKVEIPKPLEVPKAPPKPEVAPPKIKPAPEFKPTKPPRIEAAPPPPPKPTPPPTPKVPPKIESVDDIKKLGLDDFRSYREVPLDSARVITEKINSLLAEASPLDKIKALAFWKESELYKLYIEMGRESMAQGISVKELAEKRRAEGKPFLSHEEFEAIVEISGSIG